MRPNQFAMLGILALALYVPHGLGQETSSSEATLHNLIQQSGVEEVKAREAEAKVVAERERRERRLRQVQQEIANKRFEIENFKTRQENAQRELATLNIDLTDLDAQLQTLNAERTEFKASTEATQRDLGALRSEYVEKHKALESEIAELSKARKRAERAIVNQSMEVEGLKAMAARLESTKADLESKTAEMEADEMRVRTEWMQAKVAAADNAKQRDEANAKYVEAKSRRDLALKDLQTAQADLAKAQHERNDAMKKADAEVAKFEKDITDAHRARMSSESEQIRLDAEVAKIREYVARVKESRDDATEQSDKSASLVLKSTLSLEAARSELSREVSARDKANFDMLRDQARARGIAAAAVAADLVQQIAKPESASSTKVGPASAGRATAVQVGQPVLAGGRKLWKSSSNCTAYDRPDKGARAVGFLSEGNQFASLPAKKSGWVRIYGPNGTIYVEKACGQYENE